MPEHASRHHLHIIGPTGTGKSTLIAGLVAADMAAGRSVLLIDPKGDLVTDVLAHVPEHRRDDVVVLAPGSQRPVGFNIMVGVRAQAERRADQVVALLRAQHGDLLGPRSADVVWHALLAVARLKDGSVCDVPIMLTSPSFRRKVLAQVGDPLTLTPFFAWYDGLSDGECAQVVAPVLNKLRIFTARQALRRMVGQATPRFHLEELFSKRRIVLVNLNQGDLGPDTAGLLGALILNQFWSAVLRRTAVPAERRHMVAVYIDEVQNVLHLPGVDLAEFFALARGLGVALSIAHQHLGQLNATQRAAILANSRSRIAFRPASDDAKPLAAALGGGVTGEDLLRLRAFEACAQLLVDTQPTMPFSVRTRPLPPWTSDPQALRTMSGERYGVDGAALDAALTQRWHGLEDTPEGPIGVRRRRTS